jgi:hypothetical protein
MQLSIKKSLQYPFAYGVTRRRSLLLLVISFVPFFGTLFMGAVATAIISSITMERDEKAYVEPNELFERAIRAFFASLISILYMMPAFVFLSYIGYSLFNGETSLKTPSILLLAYIFIVLSVWPLATLHAVTTKNAWNALSLPKLLWIGFKIDFKTVGKVLLVSILLIGLKVIAFSLKFLGIGLFLVPINAYTEYVFQYMLAVSYAKVVAPNIEAFTSSSS